MKSKTTIQIAAALTVGLALLLSVLMVSPSTAEAQPGSGVIFGTDTACIESDTVQGDEAAVSMGVGNVYEGTDGSRHIIVTGHASCSFNCAMGFDANCDGVRGDYCRAGLDLSRVIDVGTCLAEMAAADAPAAAEAAPAATTESGLAYTGAESTALAVLGAGMLSAGAFVLGVRRKLRD